MTAHVEALEVKSGAAGAKKFPGWDSRKYNYYEPKGRKATHYEDMTVDVQPDPERYLLQNWIISFADGTPTYSKSWTKLQSSDWHKSRAHGPGVGADALSAPVHDRRHDQEGSIRVRSVRLPMVEFVAY